VPDDRFADLGGDANGRSAAERFEELDEREPEPQPRPEAPRPSGRYAWVVGIAFVIALIVAGANALRHPGAGYRGIPVGKPLKPFAAPLVTGNYGNKGVNVLEHPANGVPAACDVHKPQVKTLCELRRRPLVITFIANGGAGCETQLDRVERVYRTFPKVNFIGVLTRRSLPDAKKMLTSHGWTFPVAHDPDAVLFNWYGIGDCPTTVFARKGGISAGTRRGKLSEAQLATRVRALGP
jgi:hypothetical protein